MVFFSLFCVVGVSDYCDLRLSIIELFEKSVQVRVFVVVVEEALRKIDVRVLRRELVSAVLTVPYKKPGLERIDDKWISAGGAAIL
nr:hypothetical protein [Halomicroarcula sp. GDY20]